MLESESKALFQFSGRAILLTNIVNATQLACMCEVLLNTELKFQYLAIACYHAVFI